MKKRVFAFILISILMVSSLFAGGYDVIWLWGKNDADVSYFRYSLDEENWLVVGDEQRDVLYRFDDEDEHHFYIQQSYDGIHWSESKENIFHEKVASEDAAKLPYTKFVVGSFLTPYQTSVQEHPHDGMSYRKSVYSFSASAVAAVYPLRNVGFGVTGFVDGSLSQKHVNGADKTYFSDKSAALYGFVSWRPYARHTFDLTLDLGAGMFYDFVGDEVYSSPSALARVGVAIAVTDDISVSIAPSASISADLFDGSSSFTSYLVRAISLGVEYQK